MSDVVECPYVNGCNTVYQYVVYCKTMKYKKCIEYQIKLFLKKLTLGNQSMENQIEKCLPSEQVCGKCTINANEKHTLQSKKDAGYKL